MDDSPEFKYACGQAEAALLNFQAYLEQEHNLSGIEAARVAELIIESIPRSFTHRGIQAYIKWLRESADEKNWAKK